jgi:phosphate starvation-inducible membrane PsiE
MSLGSLQSKFTKHFASYSDGKFGTYHVIDCIVMFFCFFFGLSDEKSFSSGFWFVLEFSIFYRKEGSFGKVK